MSVLCTLIFIYITFGKRFDFAEFLVFVPVWVNFDIERNRQLWKFGKCFVEAFSESNTAETWAESIRDSLDTIEESGALAGTTAGKWFGTSSRDETMKSISETMSAAQSMLSNNPLTAILQIRTRLINTLNENSQGADGLPRNRSALGKVKDSLLPGGITNVWSNIKKVLGFADGGYPTVGTMFYAGEAGAELATSMEELA